MVVRVFRTIMAKKAALPSMSKPRRDFYMVSFTRAIFTRVVKLPAGVCILVVVVNINQMYCNIVAHTLCNTTIILVVRKPYYM